MIRVARFLSTRFQTLPRAAKLAGWLAQPGQPLQGILRRSRRHSRGRPAQSHELISGLRAARLSGAHRWLITLGDDHLYWRHYRQRDFRFMLTPCQSELPPPESAPSITGPGNWRHGHVNALVSPISDCSDGPHWRMDDAQELPGLRWEGDKQSIKLVARLAFVSLSPASSSLKSAGRMGLASEKCGKQGGGMASSWQPDWIHLLLGSTGPSKS